MNVVKEIQRINERELQLGSAGSWHDQYKDSAYIFIGGLPYDLSEGDVITIFSQYGEPLNVNLPRDKVTGKMKGFGFLMYEDQRSTVLAVDNLNGANIVGRTIRVDHVSNYKNLDKGEDGKWKEAEEEHMNARPQIKQDQEEEAEDTVSDAPSIDPEDPMRDWLLQRRKEEKAAGKGKEKGKTDKKKRKREDETPEERRARKERKRLEKARLEGPKKEIEDTKPPRREFHPDLSPPPRRDRDRDLEMDWRRDGERDRVGRDRDHRDDGPRGGERNRLRDRSRSPRRSPLPRRRDYDGRH